MASDILQFTTLLHLTTGITIQEMYYQKLTPLLHFTAVRRCQKSNLICKMDSIRWPASTKSTKEKRTSENNVDYLLTANATYDIKNYRMETTNRHKLYSNDLIFVLDWPYSKDTQFLCIAYDFLRYSLSFLKLKTSLYFIKVDPGPLMMHVLEEANTQSCY